MGAGRWRPCHDAVDRNGGLSAENKKTVDDINVKGKRVLCRCDFNVPLKDGSITDENRLVAALPTIKKLIADGGKVILCSILESPRERQCPHSLWLRLPFV